MRGEEGRGEKGSRGEGNREKKQREEGKERDVEGEWGKEVRRGKRRREGGILGREG